MVLEVKYQSDSLIVLGGGNGNSHDACGTAVAIIGYADADYHVAEIDCDGNCYDQIIDLDGIRSIREALETYGWENGFEIEGWKE